MSFSTLPKKHDPTGSSTSIRASATSSRTNVDVEHTPQRLNFGKLVSESKTWLLDPLNMIKMALLLIIIVGGAILFLLMVGWVQLRDDDQKNYWIEVFSQLLNAIFMLGVVIPQPVRFRSLYRALRVGYLERKICRSERRRDGVRAMEEVRTLERQNAMALLRNKVDGTWRRIAVDFPWMIQIKSDGAIVPRITWRRLLLIMTFLNLNCWGQYVISVAMWGWRPSTRPQMMVLPLIPVSFLASVVGGVLLGRDETRAKQEEEMPEKSTLKA